MKKSIQSIIALYLIAFLAVSCKSTTKATSATKTPAKEEKLANSLLWKISGNGLEKPSYLFGTIHMTCNYELSEKLKKAFDETSQIALEVDMDDPQMQMKVMQKMMMEDGKSIKSLLTAEEYSKLETYFNETTGMGLAMFNKMKPFSLLSLLAMKATNCEKPTSYEGEFVKIAKSQNEEVLGLETIESQIAIFDSIPYKSQLKDILKMANDGLDKTKTKFAKLSSLHQNENIEGMLVLTNETEGMTKDFADKLLDGRNKNWIPVIEKMAKEKPTFFGVGALHLPGENGVIKLLRKAGYTVIAVK